MAPKPTQKPYPPLRMASNSADTFPLAGELGLPVFTWILINPLPRLQEGLMTYRHVLESQRPPRAGGIAGNARIRAPLTERERRNLPKPSTMSYMREVDAILGPGSTTHHRNSSGRRPPVP